MVYSFLQASFVKSRCKMNFLWMAKTFLVVHGIWWTLNLGPCLCLGILRPAISEGDSVTLVCGGITFSADGDISWTRQADGQNSMKVSYCQHNRECKNSVSNRYIAATIFNHSTLKILNVTYEERNALFSCKIQNSSPQKTEARVFTSWNFSNIYHIPENAKCIANILDDDGVNVTCKIQKVYPGIICRLFQPGQNADEVEDFVKTYTKHRDSNVTYYAASCSTVRYPASPGNYTFTVQILPDVNDKHVPSITSETNVVTIISEPKVHVYQPSMEICPERNQLPEIWCKAWWLPLNVTMEWNLDNVAIGHKNIQNNVTRSDTFYTHTSIYRVQPSMSHDGSEAVCKVYINDAAKVKPHIISNATVLKLNGPPSEPPQFEFKDGRNVSKVCEVEEGENVTLLCTVKGGTPKVSSVDVKCGFPNGTTWTPEVKVVQSPKGDASVSFVFPSARDFHGTFCNCSADHINKCYKLIALVSFKVVYPGYTHPPRPYSSVDHSSVISYIVIGLVLIMILIVLIGTMLFAGCEVLQLSRTSIFRYFDCMHKGRISDEKCRSQEHIYAEIDSIGGSPNPGGCPLSFHPLLLDDPVETPSHDSSGLRMDAPSIGNLSTSFSPSSLLSSTYINSRTYNFRCNIGQRSRSDYINVENGCSCPNSVEIRCTGDSDIKIGRSNTDVVEFHTLINDNYIQPCTPSPQPSPKPKSSAVLKPGEDSLQKICSIDTPMET